jgi:diguanylate cyclase (GGDEF)-like protein
MKTNTGLVFTNAACNGCNKCLTICPIPGANISVPCESGHRIEVNAERCINCGLCISGCHNHAREYRDDTDRFLADLAAGKPIALALDPTFKIIFPQKLPQLLGYLRAQGVKKIYDVSYGAEICTWATLNYYQRHPSTSWISSQCPVMVNLIERHHPDLFPYLLPIKSPLMCLAAYVHKYLHDETPLAYIGPCLARKDEMAAPDVRDLVRYNLTYDKLFKHLEKEPLEAFWLQPDLVGRELGYLYSLSHGLKESLSYFMPPEFDVISINALYRQKSSSGLDTYVGTLGHNSIAPVLLEFRNDYLGCLQSPVVPQKDQSLPAIISSIKALRSHLPQRADYLKTTSEREQLLNAVFADLDQADFTRSFVNRYHQNFLLPEDVLENIFNAMNKKTQAARNINCGSCGYPTCRDMACAIAYGYNQMENCGHYAREKALQLSYTDVLTGIPNLNAFRRELKELFWNHPDTRYALVYFDIKNFKMVNDLYGFVKGDQILKAVAEHVYGHVKANGACARIMSDHFILCLPDTQGMVKKLVQVIKLHENNYGLDFPISFDLGIYRIEDAAIPLEMMISYARLAQLTVKGSYDIRWAYYDEAMRTRMRQDAWVTKEMRRALALKQFQVYLQPQYDHRTRKIKGAEALVRWIHPERGVISPASFIPNFEKNNFIQQLDAYVRTKTCQLLQDWLRRGLPVVPVSVNLSRLELFDAELPAKLARLTRNLPPGLLNLEITESAYTKEPEQLVAMLENLRQKGFVIEMDDFGSGYSSLNTLHEMPVDMVKLDLRFLVGEEVEKSKIILQAIALMMHKLGLTVIAEGVETAGQANFLASVGCYLIQGFYYSRPVPAAEFEKLLLRDT